MFKLFASKNLIRGSSVSTASVENGLNEAVSTGFTNAFAVILECF